MFERSTAGRAGADGGVSARLDLLFPRTIGADRPAASPTGAVDEGVSGSGGTGRPARLGTPHESPGSGSTGPGGAVSPARPPTSPGSPDAGSASTVSPARSPTSPGSPDAPDRISAGSDGLSFLSATRWISDRLRSRLRPSHEDLTHRAVVPLILGGLAVALAVGVIAWRSRPDAEPVTPPPVRSVTAAAAPTTPVAQIMVAVTGTVRHPGIVSLPDGARVADAITAAGGLLPDADLGLLNLARRLNDGEQVIVGIPGAVPDTGGATGDGTSPPVNVNSAAATELETLPGIGPAMAQRIVEWRTEHGRFESVDQLTDVPGIGPARLEQLRDRVTT